MMNANNRAAYATRIEQSNQYLQMNEMRFGNIVQLVIQQAPNTPRLTVERLVIKYDKRRLLRKRIPQILLDRTSVDEYLTKCTELLSKLQWIDFYQCFLNEPPQLLQQTRDVIVELEAVIARLEYNKTFK